MNMASPAPAGSGVTPPAPSGGGFSSPPEPSRGGLSVAVIAAVQDIYIREERRQAQLQGMGQNLGLQQGWGGQGT